MADEDRSVLKLPAKDRWASLFAESNGIYPTQTSAAIATSVGGEYRGYYNTKGKEYWRPKSSQFNGRKDHQGKPGHKGIDVYAPYYYFPLEQAIYSPVAGDLTFLYDAISPERLGNRAIVTTIVSGKILMLYFGHLTRFFGRPRKISKGELIGFAGCTGNADAQQECSTLPPNEIINIGSGHVHLITQIVTPASKTAKGKTKASATVNRVDPASLLDWKLRFAKDSKTKSLLEWKEDGGLSNPIIPTGKTGAFVAGMNLTWRRHNGRRVPLPKPCETLEFDDTVQLRNSHRALELIAARLTDQRFSEKRKKAIKSYQQVPENLAKLLKRMDAEVADFSTSAASQIAGPLLRALMLAQQALWQLMGGSAFLEMNNNKDLPGKIEKQLRAETLVQCGVGVGGEAWVSAIDGAQAALHMCRLNLNVASPGAPAKDIQPRMVNSISYGAGNFWHSTLPASVADEVASDAVKKAFIDGLRHSFAAVWQIAKVAHAFHRRLNQSPPNSDERKKVMGNFKRAKRVLEMSGRRLSHGNSDDMVAVQKLSDKQVGEVLDAMAQKTAECFAEAVKQSRQQEKNVPIGPRINFLKLSEREQS